MSVETDSLEREMHGLLAALADPDVKAVAAAWERCQTAEAELMQGLTANPPRDEAKKEQLRAGFRRLIQLNAITRETTGQAQECLSKDLSGTRKKSKQLKAYGAHSETGDTCDYAG